MSRVPKSLIVFTGLELFMALGKLAELLAKMTRLWRDVTSAVAFQAVAREGR
jgi:hypothetical protein